ncbi:MAG: T9SS type A sorting domain-containing protein [Bacteroidales bacterium]
MSRIYTIILLMFFSLTWSLSFGQDDIKEAPFSGASYKIYSEKAVNNNNAFFGQVFSTYEDYLAVLVRENGRYTGVELFKKMNNTYVYLNKLVIDIPKNQNIGDVVIYKDLIVLALDDNSILGFYKKGQEWTNDGQSFQLTTKNEQSKRSKKKYSLSVTNEMIVVGCKNISEKKESYVNVYIKSGSKWSDMSATTQFKDSFFDSYIVPDAIVARRNAVVVSSSESSTDNKKGTVLVYNRPVNGWSAKTLVEDARLIPQNETSNFGNSVDLYGNLIAVASSKGYHFFKSDNSKWSSMNQELKFIETKVDTKGSVAISDKYIAFINNDIEKGWTLGVCEKIVGKWDLDKPKFLVSGEYSKGNLQKRVKIEDEAILVGDPNLNNYGINSGEISVFNRKGNLWNEGIFVKRVLQNSKIFISSGRAALGSIYAVKDDILVTFSRTNAGFPTTGFLTIYRLTSYGALVLAKLNFNHKTVGQEFKDYSGKNTLAFDGNTIVFGYPAYDNFKGGVFVFEKPENGWRDMHETAFITPSMIKFKKKYDDKNIQLGKSVAVYQNRIALGTNQGKVIVLERPQNGWNTCSSYISFYQKGSYKKDKIYYFGEKILFTSKALIVGCPVKDADYYDPSEILIYYENSDGEFDETNYPDSEFSAETELLGRFFDANESYLIFSSRSTENYKNFSEICVYDFSKEYHSNDWTDKLLGKIKIPVFDATFSYVNVVEDKFYVSRYNEWRDYDGIKNTTVYELRDDKTLREKFTVDYFKITIKKNIIPNNSFLLVGVPSISSHGADDGIIYSYNIGSVNITKDLEPEMKLCKQENQDFVLEVVADGKIHHYEWYRDEKIVACGEENYYSTDISDENSGIYYCKIYSEMGNVVSSSKCKVQIKEGMKLIESPIGDTEKCIGQEPVLLHVKAEFVESFDWFKNGVLIENEKSSTLKVNTIKENEGNYYCRIKGSCGSIETNTAKVSFFGKEKITKQLDPQIKVEKGKSVTLKIAFEGVVKDIKWMKDGVEVQGISHYGKYGTELSIFKFSKSCEGKYSCEIEGRCGTIISDECNVIIDNVGLSEATLPNLNIYPNPVKNQLIIDLGKNIEEVMISVCNVLGNEIYSSVTTENKKEIDTSNWPEGIYMLELRKGEKTVKRKIMK